MIKIVGTRVGKLKVLQKLNTKHRRPKYRCECACGKRITVSHERLIHKTKPKLHCGCENQGPSIRLSREYHTWRDMLHRCHNEGHPGYPRYGAKGIKVCARWRASFDNFFADMGKRPVQHSIDRIDPTKGYCPENVRWATVKQQARNKRDTIYIKHPQTGKQTTIGDLADELGYTYQQMRKQLVDEGTLTK